MAVATPTVVVARQGATAVITYTGVLQGAELVQGPYTDVAGATSPYTIPAGTTPARFYRTRQ